MNKWTQISFEISYENGYLDKLHDVYPILDNGVRELDAITKGKLKTAFEKKDDALLFKALLTLNKFPIKDSYIPFFTRCKSNEVNLLIKSNPTIVSRIANRIYNLGFDKMISSFEEPIETSRQMGPAFSIWIRSKYTCYTSQEAFFNSKDEISVLAGNDAFLVEFVRKYLNLSLPKYPSGYERGLDIVVKLNTSPTPTFVIGEAKFLYDEGGMQYPQLKDALNFITSKDFEVHGYFNVIRVAILDGVCWLSGARKMQKDIRDLNDNQIAISALLLDDFFTELLK